MPGTRPGMTEQMAQPSSTIDAIVSLRNVGKNRDGIREKLSAIEAAGHTLIFPAVEQAYQALQKVKDKARELCFRVFQPANDAELAAALSDLKPDLGVAVAYGRLLKKEVLSSARLGFLNVHFSLLPKYRGAAPVQRALMNGEAVTGVALLGRDGVYFAGEFHDFRIFLSRFDGAEVGHAGGPPARRAKSLNIKAVRR